MKTATARIRTTSNCKQAKCFSKSGMGSDELVVAYQNCTEDQKHQYETETMQSVIGLIIYCASKYRQHFERKVPDSEFPGSIPEPSDVLSEIYLLQKEKKIFNKFDPTRGAKFSTFMAYWIKNVFFSLIDKARPFPINHPDPSLISEISENTPESEVLEKEQEFHSKIAVEKLLNNPKFYLSPSSKLTFSKYVKLILSDEHPLNLHGEPSRKSLLGEEKITTEAIRVRLENAKASARNHLLESDPIYELYYLGSSMDLPSDVNQKSQTRPIDASHFVHPISKKELLDLERILHSTKSNFTKRRIEIILLSDQGKIVTDISELLHINSCTVKTAIRDFNTRGFDSLMRKKYTRL